MTTDRAQVAALGQSTTAPQPPPKQSDGPFVADAALRDIGAWMPEWLRGPARGLLLADLMTRDRMGAERYGTRLQPYNARDALVDGYQEALDGLQYTTQAMLEGVAPARSMVARAHFAEAAAQLRQAIYERDGR